MALALTMDIHPETSNGSHYMSIMMERGHCQSFFLLEGLLALENPKASSGIEHFKSVYGPFQKL